MNGPEIKEFIKEHSYLFWYTPQDKKENISIEFLIETILNYGDLNSIKKLISIIGLKETAKVFFEASGRKKMNYYPEIYNYFSLFFKKHAQGNPQ